MKKLLIKHFGPKWRDLDLLSYYANIIPTDLPDMPDDIVSEDDVEEYEGDENENKFV